MTHPRGKGVWIHYASQVISTHGASAAADLLVSGGFSEAYVKTSNGYYPWLPGTSEARGLPELWAALGAKSRRRYQWSYLYPGVGRAATISAILRAWEAYPGADGLVADCEGEFKAAGAGTFLSGVFSDLRRELPGVDIGITSYRFPDVHPTFPWATALAVADYQMPQVYWLLKHNPAEQLRTCIAQYKRRRSDVMIHPIGSAYSTSTWQATEADVDAFNAEVRAQGLPAISWWWWLDIQRLRLFPALARHAWPETDGPLWAALTAEQKDSVLELLAKRSGILDASGHVIVFEELP